MADISPIIALPYDPVNWNTRNVIQMLGKFASLGMDHITWQLGSGNFCKFSAAHSKTHINFLLLFI